MCRASCTTAAGDGGCEQEEAEEPPRPPSRRVELCGGCEAGEAAPMMKKKTTMTMTRSSTVP
jgi:hypothetical protein